MDSSILIQIKESKFVSPTQDPNSVFPPPPPPSFVQSSQSNNGFNNLNNKVSPSILLIIIILAIIFFISGVLHLLVRFLLRPQNRDPDELDNVTALQGQLQQLFHLHDAGVDQSFIDALPVFNYKAIIGVKDPFDCAVCLCEFEAEDKLRLLPKCSHAFHMECIDTWLLSHSTCPLCRASLLSEFSPNGNRSPVVLVLESGGESSREIQIASSDVGNGIMSGNSVSGDREELSGVDLGLGQKSGEIQTKEEEIGQKGVVVSVKLGKFKNIDGVREGECGSSDTNSEARRCFSMGSFAYVMDERSSLQVPIRTPLKKQFTKKPSLPLTPGHRPAMSECGGFGSSREFNGVEAFKILELETTSNDDIVHKSIGRSTKKESFSVSKIWLRGKREKPSAHTAESSRRAFSFRFPIHRNVDVGSWENRFDEELGSCNSLDSQPHAPSFARRTLLWLMGKPNKVVHSTTSTSNSTIV